MQQQPSNQHDAGGDVPSDAQPDVPQHDNTDGTWGLGSATALDSLRRQNFRGKRNAPEDEHPASC